MHTIIYHYKTALKLYFIKIANKNVQGRHYADG